MDPSALRLRPLRAQEVAALDALDSSYTTEEILRVSVAPMAFTLVREPLAIPRTKRFPLDDLSMPQPGLTVVAEEEDRLLGLVAAVHHSWNRRTELRHLYVHRACRGQGLGLRLLDHAFRWACSQGARGLWVECQDCNPAAVAFYQRQGFALCGLDASLYDDEGAGAGEVALFFFKPCPPLPGGNC